MVSYWVRRIPIGYIPSSCWLVDLLVSSIVAFVTYPKLKWIIRSICADQLEHEIGEPSEVVIREVPLILLRKEYCTRAISWRTAATLLSLRRYSWLDFTSAESLLGKQSSSNVPAYPASTPIFRHRFIFHCSSVSRWAELKAFLKSIFKSTLIISVCLLIECLVPRTVAFTSPLVP